MDLSGQEAMLRFRGFKQQNWEATSLRSCFLICKMARYRSAKCLLYTGRCARPWGYRDEHVTASVLNDLTV